MSSCSRLVDGYLELLHRCPDWPSHLSHKCRKLVANYVYLDGLPEYARHRFLEILRGEMLHVSCYSYYVVEMYILRDVGCDIELLMDDWMAHRIV